MIEPMLAITLEKATILDWNDWVAERKYDGHRLIVQVVTDDVRAWTRPRKHAGKDGKTMLEQTLPEHLARAFLTLPLGTYDGELMNGRTSTDVRRKDLAGQQTFVLFDVLHLEAIGSLLSLPYSERRKLLEGLRTLVRVPDCLSLAAASPLTSMDDVSRLAHEVWDGGGEGLILKRRQAPYRPGKRSPDFVKIKKLQTEVMTVIGFKKGRGEKVDRGLYAMVVLQGEKGPTSVKTRNDAELKAFEDQAQEAGLDGDKMREHPHPAIGRKLRVEFNDWTPNEGYRHPRWDRWEDE